MRRGSPVVALPRPRPSFRVVGSLAGGRGWSGGLGRFDVVQEDLEVAQELAEAADGVLRLAGRLVVERHREAVALEEQLAAAVVVGRVDLATRGTELAGGLDGVGCVADDQRLVLRVEEVQVLVEELGQDLAGVAALHRDQTDGAEAGVHEHGLDEPEGELRLGGQLPVLVGVGADQLVLAGGHGAVAHRQEDPADGVGVDLQGERQAAEHPVGGTAGPHERLELLGRGDRGVDERATADGAHDAGAVEPGHAAAEGVLAEELLGVGDVVAQRLVRSRDADHLAQRVGGRDVREFVAERLRNLRENTIAEAVEQRWVLLDLVQAVATEVHDLGSLLGTRGLSA